MIARLGEFRRFLAVGALSSAAGWLLLYVLVGVLGLHYLVGYVLTFLLVNALAFVLGSRSAFRGAGAGGGAALLRYYGLSAVSLAANTLLLKLLVDFLGLWYLFSAVVLTLLNAPLNFLLHRRLTFRVGRRESAAP